MSYETSDITTIRKYLLGDLPESEAERVERWYFADGQAVDEVWAAFGEIAEERLSGALSDGEARRFEQKLRSSPALREMFENEIALRDHAARITAGASRQANGDDPVAGGWRRIPAAFFKAPRLMFVSVVALIALGALGAWLGRAAWFERMAPENQNPSSSQQAKNQEQKELGGMAQPTVDPQRPPGSERQANDGPAEGKKGAKSQPDQSNPRWELAPGPQPHFCCWRREPEGKEAIRHWRFPRARISSNWTSNHRPTTATSTRRYYKRSPARNFSDGRVCQRNAIIHRRK